MAKNIEIRNSTAEFLIFMLEGKEDGIQVMYKGVPPRGGAQAGMGRIPQAALSGQIPARAAPVALHPARIAVQRAETARRTPALRRGTYRRRFLRQPHHLARTADPRRTAALLSRRRRRGFHPADGHPQFGQRPAGAELRACGNGSRQRQHRRPARRDGQPGIRSRRPAVGGHRAGTGRAPLGDGPRRPQPRLCAGTLRHRAHRRNVRRALRTTL